MSKGEFVLFSNGMKKNDIQALKQKSVGELQGELAGLRTELRTLRFDLTAGKVKNVKSVEETRKTIARILTFLNIESKARPK